ncbi:hypothetical protein [[Clostridium] fimetarium]|uniref:Fibronectin type-III domain-containing protein n=1 Tax=[Clostridium] fimetarium TaxID=99656 RepID=A0A1I0MWY3_9FIRM|nr:hypothetical protein [[Clostridium] fimetarium]SEV92964.1 hypothetical protein SAMN05421659_102195 [[Clostridium] fimetarium]
MKVKMKNRVLAIIMATLMIVGLIPLEFMPTKVQAASGATETFVLDANELAPTLFGTIGTAIAADTNVGTSGFFTLASAGGKMKMVALSPSLTNGSTSYSQALQLTGAGSKTSGQACIKITTTQTARITVCADAKSTSASSFEYRKTTDSAFTTGDVLSATAITKNVVELPAGDYYIAGSNGANIFNITVEYNPTVETVTPWADVATPVINNVTTDSEGNFVVNYAAVIDSLKGAEILNISMLENGHEVATQTVKAQLAQATFSPLWSGNYTFVATAQRTGEADKASAVVKYDSYVLAVPKPVITMAQNKGNGTYYIDWINVEDASSYKVEYKAAGASVYTVAADNITTADYTFNGLTVGTTYTIKVTATRNSDNYISYYTKDVTVTANAQQQWYLATVGSEQATVATITDATGTANNYSLASTTPADLKEVTSVANTSGKISMAGQTSGKISDDEDGFSYYFTNINPNTENFSLAATFKITDTSLTPDNQTGFGIIATDMLGINFYGPADIYHKYINSVSNLLYSSTGKFLGLRSVTGYEGVNTSLADGVTRTKTESRYANTTGDFSVGTTYIFTLEKTNDAFVAKLNGETLSNADTSILSVQEDGSICVGVMVSRKISVEVSNMTFTTSLSTGVSGGSTGVEKVTPSATIYSSLTCGASTYEYIYQPNVAGTVKVTAPTGEVIYNKAVTAAQVVKINVPISVGQNTITAVLTPTASQNITSVADVTKSITVERKTYGVEGETMIVSPSGTLEGAGTEASPLDIATAVKYAQPGQTILLKNGTYSGSGVTIARSVSGTADKNITMTAESVGGVVFNGIGLTVMGSYWHIYGIEVKNATSAGIQVAGNYNTIDMCIVHGSTNSGVQISRLGSAENAAGINDLLWPSYNLIKNCESYDNCDAGRNDADGFAAKLTCGEGNQFFGCISHNNIDDGWDLYAKTISGEIGAVTIENCVAYSNGWLTTDNVTAVGYVYGEGNGFKLGGSYMKGGHVLKNCISFNNGAKGITSNSCPDCQVIDCTSFNNSVKTAEEAYSIGLNTKDMNVKEWVVKGLISMSTKTLTSLEDLIPFSLHSENNYLYNGKTSYNNQGVEALTTWFENTNVTVLPARNVNGTINMHGLLTLNATAPANSGARLDITSAAAISVQPSLTAIVGTQVIVENADYSAVTAAVAAAGQLTAAEYKDFSAVTAAVNAVQSGLKVTEQAKVTAMAKAITDAIATLTKVEKPADIIVNDNQNTTASNETVSNVNQSNESTSNVSVTVATGDKTPIIAIFCLCIFSAGVMITVVGKRKKKQIRS